MSTKSDEREASQPSTPTRYLSVPEAAEYLRVSVSWIRKATRSGELPHARLGARIIYDRLDLDEVVRQAKNDAAWRRGRRLSR